MSEGDTSRSPSTRDGTLLKFGAAAMGLALLCAAVATVIVLTTNRPEERASAAEPVASTTAGPVDTRSGPDERPDPEDQKEPEPGLAPDPSPGPQPAPPSEATREAKPEAASEPQPTPQPEPEPGPRSEPRPEPRAEPQPGPEPEPRPEPDPEPQLAPELPASEEGWQAPSEGELRAAEEPRRFAPEADAALTLTIPALGVYDAPVFDSDSPDALSRGVGHVPETSMPWDEGAQRNVYLAAHRVGYQGAGGRLLFYNLGDLRSGDEVILEGRGQTYRYTVTETLVVDPEESWVMGHVRGRDIVSLQTCTPIPTFEKRLVVRADRA